MSTTALSIPGWFVLEKLKSRHHQPMQLDQSNQLGLGLRKSTSNYCSTSRFAPVAVKKDLMSESLLLTGNASVATLTLGQCAQNLRLHRTAVFFLERKMAYCCECNPLTLSIPLALERQAFLKSPIPRIGVLVVFQFDNLIYSAPASA